jgi:hypothetical protein
VPAAAESGVRSPGSVQPARQGLPHPGTVDASTAFAGGDIRATIPRFTAEARTANQALAAADLTLTPDELADIEHAAGAIQVCTGTTTPNSETRVLLRTTTQTVRNRPGVKNLATERAQ